MIEPGDVVVALLPGARTSKRRPAVVVSTSSYHNDRPDVIPAIITSRVEDANSQFDCVLFDWRDANLRSPSAVRSYLLTVEQREITKIGHLSRGDWAEVQTRLRLAFEI